MKIAYSTVNDKDYTFLLLTDIRSFEVYKEIDQKIKAHQSWNLWSGFKSQKFRRTMGDYAAHECESNNVMVRLMSLKVDLASMETGSISMLDYCNMADDAMKGIYASMLDYVDEGRIVRINNLGGYCPIDDLQEFDEVFDINEQELYNYLLNGGIDQTLKITSKSVVLENSSRIPKRLIESYCKTYDVSPDDIQVISSFKHKCLLLKGDDIIKFFKDGIDNGLENIIFETSGQDERNVDKLIHAFQYVAREYTHRKFYIFVKTYKKELFTTTLPNITINFIPMH